MRGQMFAFPGKKGNCSLIFVFVHGLKPRPSHLGVKMSGQSAVTILCLDLESVVHGHHVYKRVWRPAIGEQLKLIREECNEHDPRAVAIVKDERVVGHMPRCIAKTVWFFLRYVRNNRTKKERKWIGSTLYL